MYKDKPYHYWAVHKEAVLQVWDNLSDASRESIASDTSGQSDEFIRFVEAVDRTAAHKFNNPNYHLNDKYTFKYAP